MRFLWCAMCLLFVPANVNYALTEELFLSFSDPVGDQDVVHHLPVVAIDVVRFDLSFSSTTGDYAIRVFSDDAGPFVGSCRINILLFNPDAGTTVDPGFFELHKDILLESPCDTVAFEGTSPNLVAWQPGNRVGNGTAAFGNPTDAQFSQFGSGVLQSVDDGYTKWKSIDYVGQDGGYNGQSTAIATIVPDPFLPIRIDAPAVAARPNGARHEERQRRTVARSAHTPLVADRPHWAKQQSPNMQVVGPRVAIRTRRFSDVTDGALATGLPVIAAFGAVLFTVRTARRAPQHLRTLIFGLISMSVSLFALGCSAIPFAPPRLCGVLTLGVGAAGTILAVNGSRQGEKAQHVWACVVGLAANTGVQLLALTLLLTNSWHVLDRVEFRSLSFLRFIDCSVLISVLTMIGIRVWLRLREQRFRFGLSSLLITSAAILVWLGLSLVLPGAIWGGGLKHPNPGDLVELITDATNFGALSTFQTLMTPFALYAVTVAVHTLVSGRRDAWPWSGLLAGLIGAFTLVIAQALKTGGV